MAATVTRIPLTITEAQFQSTVTDTMTLYRWTWCHYLPLKDRNDRWRTALAGHPGCPDIICARGSEVLLVELKRQRGIVAPGQRVWLRELGANARLWRPSDWNSGEILATLRDGISGWPT